MLDLSPLAILDNLDTIDVSSVNDSFIGHSYFASARELITDIFTLFKMGYPPDKRVGIESDLYNGKKYWKIK